MGAAGSCARAGCSKQCVFASWLDGVAQWLIWSKAVIASALPQARSCETGVNRVSPVATSFSTPLASANSSQ